MNEKSDQEKECQALSENLLMECIHSSPGAKLSRYLQRRLEKFPVEERKKIADKQLDGSSPLFISCNKGNVEIVQYLLEVCKADIEQCGKYSVPTDSSIHVVSPLWCAAVVGNLAVVKCLIKHGADIDSVSDSGSTAVRSACFMTHFDIVAYLVEHKANIQKPNYNGGTCLINSVQSVPLCRLLLVNGAMVNARDIQQKTALHYAIQEHRLETVKLLIAYGADIRVKSRYDDDALRTACLKGADSIVDYLIETCDYSDEEIIKAYELLGATSLDEHHDLAVALHYWRKALQLRAEKQNIAIKLIEPARETFQDITEFSSMTDLESNIDNVNVLRMQTLLIYERILGPLHKDTIYRIMYRGATYADSSKYEICIKLWSYAVYLRISKDMFLHDETCFAIESLLRIMFELLRKQHSRNCPDSLLFSDIFRVLSMIVSGVEKAKEYINIRPVFRKQIDNHDKMLAFITHLILLLTSVEKTEDEIIFMQYLLNRAAMIDPRSSSGQTLLHLALSSSNFLHSNFRSVAYSGDYFPDFKVAELLISCGADPSCVDDDGNTALHITAMPSNFKNEILDMLLRNDCHFDQQNHQGFTPEKMLSRIPFVKLRPMKYIQLKCLAARQIKINNIPYIGIIPNKLEGFIELH